MVLSFAVMVDRRIVFISLFLIYSVLVVIMLKNHNEILTKDLFTVLFITFMIPFSFSTLSYIRNMENGVYLLWLPFLLLP